MTTETATDFSFSLQLLFQLLFISFGDELKRATENSETRQSFFWSIIQELVSQTVPTLPATNLYWSPCFRVFGHTVFVNGLRESWPRRRVLKLWAAGEQFLATFRTHIYTGLKMVCVFFTSRKRAVWHFLHVFVSELELEITCYTQSCVRPCVMLLCSLLPYEGSIVHSRLASLV